jgi:uncharacterized protein YxjI
MSKNSADNFHLEVKTEIFKTSHYLCTYLTSGNTIVYSVTYYMLMLDQTTIQETHTSYADILFKIGLDNTEQAFSVRATNSTNFHAGINTFNFSCDNGVNFNFDTTSFNLTS